ncbi:hypothetical protein [Chromobacterium sp. ASV23]|uniref:hypothetical protein n=1 Tax=Chromobacterium sp. ASV23 TaxID=2795110 RepID=UPI0018ECCE01|nr:hypothetical protein [Chromobacterium sp. ASV23]
MSYNFDVNFQAGKFTVQVDTASAYGYFEHETLGDECGGSLWFDHIDHLDGQKLTLIDYDGVADLPRDVVAGLREHGFIVGEDME